MFKVSTNSKVKEFGFVKAFIQQFTVDVDHKSTIILDDFDQKWNVKKLHI